ncbi:MAG: hypothetical protein AAGF12_37570 [Myxococcota bacterium]
MSSSEVNRRLKFAEQLPFWTLDAAPSSRHLGKTGCARRVLLRRLELGLG